MNAMSPLRGTMVEHDAGSSRLESDLGTGSLGGTPASLREVAIPCSIPGCESVKFFAGPCNPCANADTVLRPLPTTTWVEECMAKQRAEVSR